MSEIITIAGKGCDRLIPTEEKKTIQEIERGRYGSMVFLLVRKNNGGSEISPTS